MPYIEKNRRLIIDPILKDLLRMIGRNEEGYIKIGVGDLNYIITKIIKAYWLGRKCYQALAEITGALTDARDEFKRRIGFKYEDKKIKQNGDVY